MRKILTLFLISFCFTALAQPDTARSHQTARALKLLKNSGYIGLSLVENTFNINHRFAAANYLGLGVDISVYGVTLDMAGTLFTNRNTLFYAFNDAPQVNAAQYNYSIFYGVVDLGYLVKTVSLGRNVFSLNAGLRLEYFQVGDPSVSEITSLAANGSSPISITQMGQNNNFSGYLEVIHPFWIANQSFLLSLKGSAPISIYYSKNKYFSENTYNPQIRTLFSLGLKYNAMPLFRSNPLKSKSL